MVNKQYNVQKLGKNKTKNSNPSDLAKEQLKQSITVIPNETIVNGSSDARDFYHTQNAFERNITQQYYHSINDHTFDFVDGQFENKPRSDTNTSMADSMKKSSSMANATADAAGAMQDANDTQSQKQLSIDDIERFQYILQMDREMGLPQSPDGVFRLPPLLPNTSAPSSHSNSLTSTHGMGYWKADSQSPIATNPRPSSDPHRHHYSWQTAKQLWKYTIWPLALLLVCIMVGGVVYFLIADQNFSAHSTAHELYSTNSKSANSNEPNAINFLNNYNSVNRNNNNNRSNESTIRKYESQTPPLKVVPSNNNYANPRPPSVFSTLRTTTASPRPLLSSSPPSIFIRSTTPKTYSAAQTPQPKSLLPIIATAATTTTSRPLSNQSDRDTVTVKNVKVYTNSNSRRKLPQPAPKHTTLLLPTSDDLEDNIVERSKLLFPSKETLENFGFTSGHQNSFGIPIEEDERILRILNYQMINSQPKKRPEQQNPSGSGSDDFLLLSITTDANIHQTKVSPTLPNIKKHVTATERIRATNITTTDDGICQSTTLPLCRGILPYDLTNIIMVKSITPQDLDHFQYLIESKCSKRSHEFICSILEPECRPERMGPLLPCKRICKAIHESCADVVASSEMLTAIFDCDIYPSSHDEKECKDITRGAQCLKNEFQCNDQTCIPSSWQCDNIKDCANAEDEENCSYCEENEFKCVNSDKCIPEKYHCDQYEDCPDASDELDCELADESQTRNPTFKNARTFPFANTKNSLTATTSSGPDVLILTGNRLKPVKQKPMIKTKLTPVTGAAVKVSSNKGNKTNRQRNKTATTTAVTLDDIFDHDDDDDEIQGDASGITVPISKSLANFKDSKEIMMTSDSEAEYKYSSSNYVQVNAAYVSQCPEGELRCINGHCITISQLCDKITDCIDGADEAMCTY